MCEQTSMTRVGFEPIIQAGTSEPTTNGIATLWVETQVCLFQRTM
jgi:hypothetical protein